MTQGLKKLFSIPEAKKSFPEESKKVEVTETAEAVEEVEKVEANNLAEEEFENFEGVWDEEYLYDKAYLDDKCENGRHFRMYYEMIPMSVIEAASKDPACDGVMIFFHLEEE